MWKKNLLFATVSLAGLVGLAGMLLPKNRLPEPPTVDSKWLQSAPDAAEVVAALNDEFEKACVSAELSTAARADDYTIARRLSLALTGTIPSLEELRTFQQQPPEERISWWISHLLEDQRYADYVAERLARSYVGVEDGPFILYRRRRFVAWLSEQLSNETPYNELVRRLVSDTGLWTDTPTVNFVSVTTDAEMANQPDPIRLAGRTSRAFLGMRIDCLQCHDDNLGTIELGDHDAPRSGSQQDFHQLAAFFSDVGTSLRGIQDATKPRPYEYKFLDQDEEEVVSASVPFRPDLLPQQGTRRERLATWLTHPDNKPFARAIVNRTWALLFGRPLVEPIDDIPLHEDMPPGMELLADDFIAHGYDLRRMIRLIALSEPFSRASTASFPISDDHERLFAVFQPTRLRPEQVAGSIVQASSLSTIDNSASIISRLIRFGEEGDFVKRYGDRGEDEFASQAATIPQQLILMNGKLVSERDQANPILMNSISQIAVLSSDAETIVRNAYLTVLTREPSPRELEYFVPRFRDASWNEKSRRLEDLFWVLYKSPDFAWNR